MKVKKFIAEDFQSAIYQAKKEMGKDAIILNSRQLKKKGFLSFFGKPRYEVTVAIDNDLRVGVDRFRHLVPKKSNYEEGLVSVESKEETVSKDLLEEMQQMKGVMNDIRGKLYEVDVIKGLSQPLQKIYDTLTANRVSEELSLLIVSSLQSQLPHGQFIDSGAMEVLCVQAIAKYMGAIKPIELDGSKKSKVVVLIGPTGVGKTTTIAKLAANMAFIEGAKVGLITLDTYRVSAAEQLRTFADIIDVPIKVVFNPDQLVVALDEMGDRELIFIDTAGRSPFNNEHMEELELFLNVAHADEVILVISATTESSDLLTIYEKFNHFLVDKIIFTKLDEICCLGQLFNILNEFDKPVAYFTTGQNVPDDIEVPDPIQFGRMLLRKDELNERPGQ
ncbi:MAG: flagellar biosynthesis protein FlhF [Bacillota bacterium]|nr:flagellar biosynthesis protein FlhF [Bacillota bacterium]